MYKLPSRNTILTIGTAVLVLVFIFQIRKALARLLGLEEREPVDYPDTPIPVGVSVNPQFDPTVHVARLIEVLAATYFVAPSPRCKAYQKLLDLNDAEFIIVVNAYKNTTGKSLRGEMDRMFTHGCVMLPYLRYGSYVIDRMDELGVIG